MAMDRSIFQCCLISNQHKRIKIYFKLNKSMFNLYQFVDNYQRMKKIIRISLPILFVLLIVSVNSTVDNTQSLSSHVNSQRLLQIQCIDPKTQLNSAGTACVCKPTYTLNSTSNTCYCAVPLSENTTSYTCDCTSPKVKNQTSGTCSCPATFNLNQTSNTCGCPSNTSLNATSNTCVCPPSFTSTLSNGVYTCACNSPSIYNATANTCRPNCATITNANSTDNTTGYCTCSSPYYFDITSSTCFINCTLVQNSNGINNSTTTCNCNSNYAFDKTLSICRVNCSQYDQAIEQLYSNSTECICNPGYFWDSSVPACSALSTTSSVNGLIIAGSIIGALGVGGIIAAPFFMKSAVNAAAANPGLLQPAVATGVQQVPVAYTTNAPMGQPTAYQVVQYGNGGQYGGQGGQVYGQNTYQVLQNDNSAQGLNFQQGV